MLFMMIKHDGNVIKKNYTFLMSNYIENASKTWKYDSIVLSFIIIHRKDVKQ